MKHTQGEWEVREEGNGIFIKTGIGSKNGAIALVYEFNGAVSVEEAEANAKLIASAPKLLEKHESDLILLDVCLKVLKDDKKASPTIISHLECIVESKKRVIKKATE